VDGRWARGRKHQRAPHEKERRPVSLDLFLVPPLDDGRAAGSPLQLSIWVERLNLVYVCAVFAGAHAHTPVFMHSARSLAGRTRRLVCPDDDVELLGVFPGNSFALWKVFGVSGDRTSEVEDTSVPSSIHHATGCLTNSRGDTYGYNNTVGHKTVYCC